MYNYVLPLNTFLLQETVNRILHGPFGTSPFLIFAGGSSSSVTMRFLFLT